MNNNIKTILLKIIQFVLLIVSLVLYIRFSEIKYSSEFNEETSNQTFYYWFGGFILFITGWSIGTYKSFSKIILFFFIYKCAQEFVLHLPSCAYDHIRGTFDAVGQDTSNIAELFQQFAPQSLTAPFSNAVIATQLGLIVVFALLGNNVYLADKFWMIKTVIIDWVLAVILIIVTGISDLSNKQNNFFLVLSYIFGANILGYGVIKVCEFFWNYRSKCDDIKNAEIQQQQRQLQENVVFDTDNEFVNEESPVNTQQTDSINNSGEIQPVYDSLDYNSLSESQLDEILSAPSPSIPYTRKPQEKNKITFINNLVAPQNIHQKICAKEMVGCVILWIYSISNSMIQHFNIYSTSKILVVIGFSTTILAYLSTISSKRLGDKKPSSREC
ncbi:hypothetical protein CYY_000701 [Polysphondylium violaceum]|uniref:Transmembrane protein n=1 Tax=Polysphondylium violaceum TaxID=133409 RepID=A0A8J4Q3B0_9MYCE|nr:hypothetical protein CYY_000701 [Polysphondylium violaceum]